MLLVADLDGLQPHWRNSAMKKDICLAAVRAMIVKHLGWHTLPRTFGTLLKTNDADVATV
jgi:hypothetical protein